MNKYIETAILEIEKPTFSLTEQYLESYVVARNNNIPIVARVETDQYKDRVIVYFKIEEESFYLAISVSKQNTFEVVWIWIEAGNRVYLRATSETLSFDELSHMTSLKPVSGWSLGQPRRATKLSVYDFSALHFDPFPNEAYDMEYKISLLLNEIEQDEAGVKQLSANANAYVSIASYRSADHFGGIHLDMNTIKRLNNLGLPIDFDIYVYSNDKSDTSSGMK